jgi:hypothetical protein
MKTWSGTALPTGPLTCLVTDVAGSSGPRRMGRRRAARRRSCSCERAARTRLLPALVSRREGRHISERGGLRYGWRSSQLVAVFGGRPAPSSAAGLRAAGSSAGRADASPDRGQPKRARGRARVGRGRRVSSASLEIAVRDRRRPAVKQRGHRRADGGGMQGRNVPTAAHAAPPSPALQRPAAAPTRTGPTQVPAICCDRHRVLGWFNRPITEQGWAA